MAKKTSAAAKKRSSTKGSRRSDRPRNYWTKPAGQVNFGREEFRVLLSRRRRKLPTVSLDPLVEHLDWSRDGATLVGEMNLRRPTTRGNFRLESLIARGDEVVIYLSTWGRGRWKEYRRLVVAGNPEQDLAEGAIAVSLRSSTAAVKRSRVGWKYRKDRQHKRGWKCHQIARHAARRFGIKVGKLATGKHWIEKLADKKASVLDIVTRAYAAEKKATGQKFIVDLSRGRLDVLPIRHPRYMHVLGPAIVSATTKHSLKGYATTLVAIGTVKVKGGKRKKVRVRVVDKKRRKLYGEIVKTVTKNGLGSRAALRRWAKRELARTRLPRSGVTFTHPGLPWLDRGDALRLNLVPEANLLVTCYVTGVRHTLSAGSYEMEVTVGFSDPWVDGKRKKTQAKKKAAAARRGKRQRGDTHPPTPKKAARRR